MKNLVWLFIAFSSYVHAGGGWVSSAAAEK